MAHRLRTTLLGASLMLITACDAPTAPAENPPYSPTSLTGGLLYHWDLGHTIGIYVDPTAGGGDLRQHVVAGAEAWKDVMRYRENDVALVSTPEQADVIIHTQSAPYLVDFPADCGTPGTSAGGNTFFCSDVGGTRLTTFALLSNGGGHVKMDMMIDPADAPTVDELRSLVTHELGHVLGIGGHSNDSSDLMFAAPSVVRPSARDASTLRYVLHQRRDLRP